MKRKFIAIYLLAALLALLCSNAYARLNIELGTGGVFTSYNDIRVPGDPETDISLSDELETDPDYFIRAKIIYSRRRHNVEFFASPLRLKASGKVNKRVKLKDAEFSENIPLTAVYQSDSYRITYRYDFINTRELQAGIGFTTNIRNNSITFEGAGLESAERDIDFLPLINFRMRWIISRKADLIIEGDVLAISQGRVEDVLFTIHYKLNKNIAVNLGYRLLEDSTDVADLHNFKLLNYAVVGPVITF